MSRAVVTEIQVGGVTLCNSLEDACAAFLRETDLHKHLLVYRPKINFTVKLPNGEIRTITIRDENGQTVAYGNFEGLPDFLEYSKDVIEKK